MALEDTLTGPVFDRFRDLVYTKTGIALGSTKKSLLVSRLAKRAKDCGCQSFQDYYDAVIQATGGEEFLNMLDCITTNKTDFFREPVHFSFLRDVILASMGTERRLSVWSAACSSGEEPYSIAMTITDAMKQANRWDWRILASDISTRVLAQAKTGRYEMDRVERLPSDALHRHFLKGTGAAKGTVKVKSALTDHIAFRRINLMDEVYPIKTQLDVIFCRNVMIYFDRATQESVLRKFCRYLKVGGYLFVGHSESLQWVPNPFTYVAPTIYRKG
jgi:chemotaxis protein methyltransferase CheR